MIIYQNGTPGHYNGHTVAMTGVYSGTNVNLNINPENPTVFEFYRKHNDPVKSALNAWWISEDLGPYPEGSDLTIQGERDIVLDNSILLDDSKDSEATTFSIRLMDRTGNWSNSVETGEIVISQWAIVYITTCSDYP